LHAKQVKSSRMLEPLATVGLLVLAIYSSSKEDEGSHPIWEAIIKGSDPVLTVLEGFGTILMIQWSSRQVRRLAGKGEGYQVTATSHQSNIVQPHSCIVIKCFVSLLTTNLPFAHSRWDFWSFQRQFM